MTQAKEGYYVGLPVSIWRNSTVILFLDPCTNFRVLFFYDNFVFNKTQWTNGNKRKLPKSSQTQDFRQHEVQSTALSERTNQSLEESLSAVNQSCVRVALTLPLSLCYVTASSPQWSLPCMLRLVSMATKDGGKQFSWNCKLFLRHSHIKWCINEWDWPSSWLLLLVFDLEQWISADGSRSTGRRRTISIFSQIIRLILFVMTWWQF